MVKYIIVCFVSILLLSPAAFGEEGSGGYLQGGPSENFETPNLDLQRSYYGTFEKEKELKATPARVKEAKPLAEPVIKDVPTVAEVEAAKAKATAETAVEISKKAEATANQARQASAEAKTTSEQSTAAANQAIQTANQAIEKTNQTIDRVNSINENLAQENAKLRFEMEQKTQALEQKDQGLADEMANLKKSLEKTTVQEAQATFASYKVKKGDFLIKIAGKQDIYGDSAEWKTIYQANREKIKNPNLIYPGQELQIPKGKGPAPKNVKVKSVKKAAKPAAAPTTSKTPAPATSKPAAAPTTSKTPAPATAKPTAAPAAKTTAPATPKTPTPPAASKTPAPAPAKAAPGKPVVKVPGKTK